jgi:hypothetical protein
MARTEFATKYFGEINATAFFSKYLPNVKNVKHKMRGIDGNGNPIDFSDTEKKEILKALAQMCKDLKSK